MIKSKFSIIVLPVVVSIIFSIFVFLNIQKVDAQEILLNGDGTFLSPHKQLENGVELKKIQCNDDKTLVFKAKTLSPACIKKEHFPSIFERNWITKDPLYLNSKELSIQVAKQFVISSPTFANYGISDSLEFVGFSTRQSLPPQVGVEFQFSTIDFTFDKQSKQTDELSSHNFYIGIRNWNEIHRAIIDDLWDELNQEMMIKNEN